MQNLWLGFQQFLIALDQVINTVLAMLTGRIGWADETMSAHCWRAATEGKPAAKFFLPIVDWMFSWQANDPTIVDERGAVITTHCHRAFMKEKLRRGLPPEYREAPTAGAKN